MRFSDVVDESEERVSAVVSFEWAVAEAATEEDWEADVRMLRREKASESGCGAIRSGESRVVSLAIEPSTEGCDLVTRLDGA